MESLKERADEFEKSLIGLNIKSEGKISLSDVYALPFYMREKYIKMFNEYLEEKSKQMSM